VIPTRQATLLSPSPPIAQRRAKLLQRTNVPLGMDGRIRRAWRSRTAIVDPDGYRHFHLPSTGSDADPTDETVSTICDEWFVAEADFVRTLMRKVAGSRGRDAIDYAAATTALVYFQAVRNGNGMARYIRAHLDGSNPIREPKGLFIRTIELHRGAALREDRSRQFTAAREATTDPSVLPTSSRDHRTSSTASADVNVDAVLRARSDLTAMARDAPPTPDPIESRLDELESLCSEEVRKSGMLASLTSRQRLVFLLRANPLADVDGLALDYEEIASLAATLGNPTTAEALRQSLRAARERLRTTHADVRQALSDG
jgi:hypothetical protein